MEINFRKLQKINFQKSKLIFLKKFNLKSIFYF